MATFSVRQSGSTTIPNTGGSATATVSSYTAANTILKISVRGGNTSPTDDMVRAVKTNSTTLTFTRTGTTVTTVVFWELIEFSDGVTVQDISVSAEGTQAISAVDLGQSWLTITGLGANSGFSGKYAPLLQFNSTTQIELDTDSVAWGTGGTIQVVDYTGCDVQNTTRTLTTSTATQTTTTLTAVDTDVTLVFGSMKIDGNPILFNAGFWRCFLASSVSQQMNRNAGTSFTMNFNMFAVEFTDDTAVQDVQGTITGGSTTGNFTFSAVTQSRTMTWLGGCNAYGMSTGLIAHAGDGGTHAMFTSAFTTTTNFQVVRVGTSDNSSISGQSIEFAAPAVGGTGSSVAALQSIAPRQQVGML